MNSGPWKIARREAVCSTCQRAFEDGERHASSLAIRGEHLVREDFCAACFAARVEADQGLFWWFTHHRVEERKAVRLDLDALDRLFDALATHDAPTARELCYLISLLLMRKRRLKLERVERGPDGEALLLRRPRKQELTRVFVFDFDRGRIDVLRDELRALFEGLDSEDGVDLGALVAQAEAARAAAAQDGSVDDAPAESAGGSGAPTSAAAEA
jgi:hypothetical protein